MTDMLEKRLPLEPPRPASRPLDSLLARLVTLIERELSTGDLAELRRLSPEQPGCPAFWRIVAMILEPGGHLPERGPSRDEAERHWAVILSGMAQTAGLHRADRPCGWALARAGFSELRFVRLLRARGQGLERELRAAVSYLVSKAEPVDWGQLAGLILHQEGERGERLRRAVARDYYRGLNS